MGRYWFRLDSFWIVSYKVDMRDRFDLEERLTMRSRISRKEGFVRAQASAKKQFHAFPAAWQTDQPKHSQPTKTDCNSNSLKLTLVFCSTLYFCAVGLEKQPAVLNVTNASR